MGVRTIAAHIGLNLEQSSDFIQDLYAKSDMGSMSESVSVAQVYVKYLVQKTR